MKNRKYRVIGFGALNWDDIRKVDEIVGPGGETSGSVLPGSPGGSAANTIVGLSRLGIETAFVGAVGNDETGRYIVNSLVNEGVEPLVITMKGHTGNCIILVDKGGERRIFVFPEVNDIISFGDIPESTKEAIRKADYFYSSTFASTDSYDSLETQFELSKIAQRFVFSPGTLYTDPESRVVREKKEIILDLLRKTDILFLNEEEIKNLTGEVDHTSSSKKLMKDFGNMDIIAVTLGEDGCYIRSRSEEVKVGAYLPESIRDTVGAGDSFAAGFMYGLLNGKGLTTCGEIGNYSASRVIGKTGAREGLPDHHDPYIEELLSRS